MRIIEYKMVNNSRDRIINAKVNALIKLGWQPLGGISNHNDNFCQAMVKYATQKDDAFKTMLLNLTNRQKPHKKLNSPMTKIR